MTFHKHDDMSGAVRTILQECSKLTPPSFLAQGLAPVPVLLQPLLLVQLLLRKPSSDAELATSDDGCVIPRHFCISLVWDNISGPCVGRDDAVTIFYLKISGFGTFFHRP